MLWEMIATLSCAFSAAGIMLMLRVFWKKQPKWLIPASAGVGILAFQIYSEYTWFEHTQSRLPEQSVVVAQIAEPVFYRPWSYIYPPILKFAVVDKTAQSPHSHSSSNEPMHTQLYLFERRMSAKTLPIAVDCQKGLQANVSQQQNGKVQYDWGKGEFTDKIVQAVCTSEK